MKMILTAAALVLGLAATAHAQDDIDLGAAVFHGLNPAGYPATVTLSQVEFQPGRDRGVKLHLDMATMRQRWPDVIVWPPAGYIQWTFYVCVPVPTWHCSGMFEMFSDRTGPNSFGGQTREWSGAPLLERTDDGSKGNWEGNWAYAADRWGAMSGWRASEGAEMAFFAVAGAVRLGSSNHPTVQERSNVLRVRLARSGIGPRVAPAPDPPPSQPPVVQPPYQPPYQPPAAPPNSPATPPVITRAEWDHLTASVGNLRAALEHQTSLLTYIREHTELQYQDIVRRLSVQPEPPPPVAVDPPRGQGGVNWTQLATLLGTAAGGIVAGIMAR